MSSTVVSIRIPRKLKEEAEKFGISISEVARKALEEAVKRKKLEKAGEAAEELRELFSHVSVEEWVRVIREAREEE